MKSLLLDNSSSTPCGKRVGLSAGPRRIHLTHPYMRKRFRCFACWRPSFYTVRTTRSGFISATRRALHRRMRRPLTPLSVSRRRRNLHLEGHLSHMVYARSQFCYTMSRGTCRRHLTVSSSPIAFRKSLTRRPRPHLSARRARGKSPYDQRS